MSKNEKIGIPCKHCGMKNVFTVPLVKDQKEIKIPFKCQFCNDKYEIKAYQKPLKLCPWCNKETQLILQKDFEIWEYHAGDWSHSIVDCKENHREYWKCKNWMDAAFDSTSRTNNSDEWTFLCKNCNKPIHYMIWYTEDMPVEEFIHPIEKILEYPTRNTNKRKFFSKIGVPIIRKISIFFMAILLGLFLISPIYFIPLIFLEKPPYYSFQIIIWGLFNGVVIYFLYGLLKKFKIILASLQPFLTLKRDIFETARFMFRFDAWVIAIIFTNFTIFINNGTDLILWKHEAIGIPSSIVIGFAMQVFAGYGLFLMALPTRNPYLSRSIKGPYIILRNKVEPLIEIGVNASLFIAIWFFISFFSTIFSPRIDPNSSNLLAGFYFPIIGVILVFMGFSYLLHNILSELKRVALEDVRNQIVEVNKCLDNNKVSKSYYSRIGIKLNYLLYMEDKYSKLKEWPFSPGISGNFALSILLVVLPVIYEYLF